MPQQCNFVANANAVRMWYCHRGFFTTRVNFDEDGVAQNWQGRVVLGEIFSLVGSFEYLNFFWVLR
jgi:hypothetical protein